jgi:hypothetical protein
MRILRMRGLEEYKSYLKLFDPPEEEINIPRLQIFKCKGVLPAGKEDLPENWEDTHESS